MSTLKPATGTCVAPKPKGLHVSASGLSMPQPLDDCLLDSPTQLLTKMCASSPPSRRISADKTSSSSTSPSLNGTGNRHTTPRLGPFRSEETPLEDLILLRTPPVDKVTPLGPSASSVNVTTSKRATGPSHKRSLSHTSLIDHTEKRYGVQTTVVRRRERKKQPSLSRSACSSEQSSINENVENELNGDTNSNFSNGVEMRNGHGANDSASQDRREKTERRISNSGLKSALRILKGKSYAQRSAEFRKNHGDLLAAGDRYVSECSCAYLNDRYLLLQGKMYITQRSIIFVSRVFGKTKLCMPFDSVVVIKKEKTIKLIENAIRISLSDGHSYFFASFTSRNETFNILARLHQAAHGQPLSSVEFWALLHATYGSDLGFSPATSQAPSPTASPFPHTDASPDYSDYQEYLAAVQRGGVSLDFSVFSSRSTRTVNQNGVRNSSTSGNTVPSLERPDADSLNDSDPERLGVEVDSDIDDESDSQGLLRRVSYVSLSDPDAPTCCGHEPLEAFGMQQTYNLPIEKMYDHVFNMYGPITRTLFEEGKSKLVKVEEWQSVALNDADRERMPIPESAQSTVELVKLQRQLIYTTSFTIMFTATLTNEEQQSVLMKRSIAHPDRIYTLLVNSRVDSSGVPLAKNAYYLRQFCMHRADNDVPRTRFTASTQMVFKSNFQKQAVMSQTNARTERYYKRLNELLIKEAEATQNVPLERSLASRAAGSETAATATNVRIRSPRKTSNNISIAVDTVSTFKRQASVITAVNSNEVIPNNDSRQSADLALASNPRLERSIPFQYLLVFFLLCLLAFIIWSQHTVSRRVENIETLLRELLALTDAERARSGV